MVKRILGRNTFYSIFDQVLVSGGNFLLIALGAHFLSMADQGKLGYINTIYIATIVINQSLIFQWANVKAPRIEQKDQYQVYLTNLQLFSGVLSALSFMGFLRLLAYFSNWNLPLQAWIVFFFFLIFQQISDFGRRSSYIFRSSRQAWLNSMCIYPLRILLLLVIHPTSVLSFLLIMLLTSLPPAVMVLVRSLKFLSIDKEFFQNTREHLREVKWLLISSPFSFLWGMIPVYAGGLMLSLNEVGLYTTLNSINNVGNVAMELLETEFSAKAGKVAASDRASIKAVFRKVLVTGLGAWVLGMVVVIVFRDLIIRIIAGNAYLAGEKLMILLWGSVLFMFLSRLDTVLLRTMEKTRTVFNSYFIATLIALLTAWPLIKTLGVYGIAVSVIMATVSIFLYQRYVIYRTERIQPSHEEIVNHG